MMPLPDCQMPCDPDCEIAGFHCWNHHRPGHKPDWHDPDACDIVREDDALCALASLIRRPGPLPPYPPWDAEYSRRAMAEDPGRPGAGS